MHVRKCSCKQQLIRSTQQKHSVSSVAWFFSSILFHLFRIAFGKLVFVCVCVAHSQWTLRALEFFSIPFSLHSSVGCAFDVGKKLFMPSLFGQISSWIQLMVSWIFSSLLFRLILWSFWVASFSLFHCALVLVSVCLVCIYIFPYWRSFIIEWNVWTERAIWIYWAIAFGCLENFNMKIDNVQNGTFTQLRTSVQKVRAIQSANQLAWYTKPSDSLKRCVSVTQLKSGR